MKADGPIKNPYGCAMAILWGLGALLLVFAVLLVPKEPFRGVAGWLTAIGIMLLLVMIGMVAGTAHVHD